MAQFQSQKKDWHKADTTFRYLEVVLCFLVAVTVSMAIIWFGNMH